MRALLWLKWDALGVRDIAPDDEYDAHARVLGSKLRRGNGREDIARYLTTAVTDQALITPEWVERCDRAARDLLDWYAQSNAPP